jgi:16S rRNA (adenine1518-N6/adenine1519-N6)-dimethyltransferase
MIRQTPRQPARNKTAVAGHTARKRFGQNFLVDADVIRRIVDAIAPRVDDNLVEIGPGLGALTEALLARCSRLQAIEIDRDLLDRLRRRWPAERLSLHAGDALSFDFATLTEAGPLRIVGNLPYNISTPLLFHLFDYASWVKDMHFMLQKEVVERMTAAPGSRDYGRLSVMLQYHYHLESLFEVPPTAFRPAPKVDSAVVRMVPRVLQKVGAGETAGNAVKPAVGCIDTVARDEALFARLVAAAFSQRRKMLRNTLRDFLTEDELAAQGVAPTARAEELDVATYLRLANGLAVTRPPQTLAE